MPTFYAVFGIYPPLPLVANTAKMVIPLYSPFIFLLSMWQVEALPFLANKGLDGAEHKVRISKEYHSVICVCPLVVIGTLLTPLSPSVFTYFCSMGRTLEGQGGRRQEVK